jgi:glycosyltransferase involved in cell wall biosynthesis
MRAELEAMGIEGVSFGGELHGEELSRAYASADIFCSLSESETFGNVVVEAQASGLPVVVGDRGGMLEHMIDGETGLIVPSREPEQVAAALDALLSEEERLGRMCKRAVEHASSYDLSSALHATFDLYCKELRHRPSLGVVPDEPKQEVHLSSN